MEKHYSKTRHLGNKSVYISTCLLFFTKIIAIYIVSTCFIQSGKYKDDTKIRNYHQKQIYCLCLQRWIDKTTSSSTHPTLPLLSPSWENTSCLTSSWEHPSSIIIIIIMITCTTRYITHCPSLNLFSTMGGALQSKPRRRQQIPGAKSSFGCFVLCGSYPK